MERTAQANAARVSSVNGRRRAALDAEAGLHKPDISRLLRVLQHHEADRVPHLEFWVSSKAVYEYVLERELKYEISDARAGGQTISPEDDVEFAQRLGMDAVTCNFSWRPGNRFARASYGAERYAGGQVKDWPDLEDLEPPPPLTDQLSRLERYLRAAQGTGVGVIANFTSFFDSALLAIGVTDALEMLMTQRPFVERLMDLLLRHQSHVMRAVCDRFADELALVLVNDDIAYKSGLLVQPDLFAALFLRRMSRLVEPAREHGKLLGMHTDGRIGDVLPLLYDLGFRVLHPIEPECNDIRSLRDAWRGRLAFIGNIPTTLLSFGTNEAVEAAVREACARLGPGGGYVVGSSGSIVDGIPPARFVTMTQAAHTYGRYDLLAQKMPG